MVEPYRPQTTIFLQRRSVVCQITKARMQTHTQNM